jgi:hypothetical protein
MGPVDRVSQWAGSYPVNITPARNQRTRSLNSRLGRAISLDVVHRFAAELDVPFHRPDRRTERNRFARFGNYLGHEKPRITYGLSVSTAGLALRWFALGRRANVQGLTRAVSWFVIPQGFPDRLDFHIGPRLLTIRQTPETIHDGFYLLVHLNVPGVASVRLRGKAPLRWRSGGRART